MNRSTQGVGVRRTKANREWICARLGEKSHSLIILRATSYPTNTVKPRENAAEQKRCCDLPVRGARVKELLRASIAFVNNGLRKVCVGDALLLLSCESLGGRRSFLSLPLLLLLRHSDHHFLPTSWTVPGLRSFSCFSFRDLPVLHLALRSWFACARSQPTQQHRAF